MLDDWNELKDDSRCICGGRFFHFGEYVVTCTDGRAFKISWVSPVWCTTCGRNYVYPRYYPKDSGKKKFLPVTLQEGQFFVVTGEEVRPSLNAFLDKVADLELASQDTDHKDRPACKLPYHKRGEGDTP